MEGYGLRARGAAIGIVLILSLLLPTGSAMAAAVTLVSVSGGTAASLLIDSGEGAAVNFSLANAETNVEIRLDASQLLCVDCAGEANLVLDADGLPSTIANLIQTVTFDATDAVPIDMTGLNLAAGNYFLVVSISDGFAVWASGIGATVTTNDGASHLLDYTTEAVDASFPPSSDFTFRASSDALYYTVLAEPREETASLDLTKIADTTAISAGGQAGYTVTLTNSGNAAVTGLSLTDALPTGGGSLVWTISPASAGWSINGGNLVYSPTTLAANSSTSAHVIATTSTADCGTLSNTAAATTTNGGSDQQTATITVSCPTSQITETNATCQSFSSETAPALTAGQYSVKGGKIIQANPGAIFYWVAITVSSAGANSVTISQSIPTANTTTFLAQASGSRVYQPGCTKVARQSISSSGATTIVTFTAPSPGTYVIGLKLSPAKLGGSPAPTVGTLGNFTVRYQLSASGSGVPASSTQTFDLLRK